VSGGVPIIYHGADYQIPINIIIPENFPFNGPKVNIGYALDEASASTNPLVKYGNQIICKYLQEWKGNDTQYNLGGLIHNLSKLFSMHPPLGKAGYGVLEQDVIYIHNDDSRPKPQNVIQKQYTKIETPQHIPEETAPQKPGSAPFLSEEAQILQIKEEERQELLKNVKERYKVKHKALKYSKLTFDQGGADCFKASKRYLEDNSEKLKKQSFLLESEIADMEVRVKKMKDFIENNKEKDVSETNIDEFIFATKDGISDSLLEIVSKEQSIEETIDVVKTLFRKKTIDLETYLEKVRDLAEEQFFTLAMKRKLLALLKQSS